MTKREELIATWNSFKPKLLKLQKLTCFQQHKKLLQEAVEFHLNWVTEFITPRFPASAPDIPTGYQLTPLTKPIPEELRTKVGAEYVKKLRRK